MRRFFDRHRWLCEILTGLIVASLAPSAMADVPADCTGSAGSIQAVEDLYWDARFTEALRDIDSLPSGLAPSCLAYVRSLRAQILFKLDRQDDALAEYDAALSADPLWRPDPTISDPAALTSFEQYRDIWIKSRTGSFTCSPPAVEFASEVGIIPSEPITITITSTAGKDVFWEVKDRTPFALPSRLSGFTRDGTDSFDVELAPPRMAAGPTTLTGEITLVSPGAFETTIPVTWEVTAAPDKKPFYKKPAVLVGGAVVLGAIIVAAVSGGGGDDPPPPEQTGDTSLEEFPPPPGGAPGFSFAW